MSSSTVHRPRFHITRRVSVDLALLMAGFGLLIGVVFPFFVLVFGVPASKALSFAFFAACILAGLVVGAVNFGLARLVLGRRARTLRDQMLHVAEAINVATYTGDWAQCNAQECELPVDSDDEFGESAAAFNELVHALEASRFIQEAAGDLVDALNQHLDLDELAGVAVQKLLEMSGADAGALIAIEDAELEVVASTGLEDGQDLLESSTCNRAIRDCSTVFVDLPDDLVLDAALVRFRPSWTMCIPILFHSVAVGVLVLAGSRPIGGEVRKLLEMLVPSLGTALKNALTHGRLQRLAAVDPLTGVYNRRFGMSRLEEEMGRAIRNESALGLLMIDLDHFKAVNDTYGHLVGDRVLKMLSGTIRRCLRQGDVVVRYGGEEFLAVLPGADIDDVSEVAGRIRRSVEEMTIREGNQEIKVTVSLGAASFPGCFADNSEELIQAADKALYSAKVNGRNRLELAK
ncbi:MAG: diguanylate cyclase [Actinobacteria bacterium ATB1]|nr:diguanylate cyclase [Actinobacteria bacterium ATB1]